MFREFFAEKLSNLIKIKKITNQQLANELNLTRQSISQFTKGTAMPSIEKLIAIADFFNISIDELLGRKNVFSAPNTTNFDSNRTVFNLLNNPDGILEYKIFVPTIESQPTDDGRLLIDLSSKLKKGKFKYSFALIKQYSIYRSYLFLDEIEGDFIDFVLEKSKNKDNFISLVNIINQQLGLNYDAYNYNRVALVIKIY
ncbi:MAG: helix-turn-helix domain-containing protein [Megamonas funiformis]